MGLFQHQYADWKEAVDWGSCPRKFVTCDFCGKEFEANSPNQKRHRRNYELQGEGDYLDAAACEDEQWKASLSRRSFVTRVLGMTVKEFIEIHGRSEYESL
jgi:hypothetical protein